MCRHKNLSFTTVSKTPLNTSLPLTFITMPPNLASLLRLALPLHRWPPIPSLFLPTTSIPSIIPITHSILLATTSIPSPTDHGPDITLFMPHPLRSLLLSWEHAPNHLFQLFCLPSLLDFHLPAEVDHSLTTLTDPGPPITASPLSPITSSQTTLPAPPMSTSSSSPPTTYATLPPTRYQHCCHPTSLCFSKCPLYLQIPLFTMRKLRQHFVAMVRIPPALTSSPPSMPAISNSCPSQLITIVASQATCLPFPPWLPGHPPMLSVPQLATLPPPFCCLCCLPTHAWPCCHTRPSPLC